MDLVGVIYLTKGLTGANMEPMTGWSQEKRFWGGFNSGSSSGIGSLFKHDWNVLQCIQQTGLFNTPLLEGRLVTATQPMQRHTRQRFRRVLWSTLKSMRSNHFVPQTHRYCSNVWMEYWTLKQSLTFSWEWLFIGERKDEKIKRGKKKSWRWWKVFTWRDKETGKEEKQNRNQHNAEGRNTRTHTHMQKENILATSKA